jgi:serine/threonine protein kinase
MQSIHQHKMVHADLKPANLVIVNGSIKIIDFGISMNCGANTTAIHRDDNTGTLNYMSPEAISNNGVPPTDTDHSSVNCNALPVLLEHILSFCKLPTMVARMAKVYLVRCIYFKCIM